MAIKLTTPSRAASENGLKILVHAPAGSGKTKLIESLLGCAAVHEIVVISAEKGLLSLANGPAKDVPTIEITEFKDVDEAYNLIIGPEGTHFKWVVLDSVSDIAEVCLANEKKKAADPRQAYGGTQDKVFEVIRKFRDLPGRNVYFIAKQKREKDEQTGLTLYVPMMPGNSLAQGVSYHFDEVFALRVVDDGVTKDARVLQTGRDVQFDCKDRSGRLAMYEPANLTYIRNKIVGDIAATNNTQEKAAA